MVGTEINDQNFQQFFLIKKILWNFCEILKINDQNFQQFFFKRKKFTEILRTFSFKMRLNKENVETNFNGMKLKIDVLN